MAAALRERISSARRIIIKVGTSVVTDEDGYLALGRLGFVVEQVRTSLH